MVRLVHVAVWHPSISHSFKMCCTPMIRRKFCNEAATAVVNGCAASESTKLRFLITTSGNNIYYNHFNILVLMEQKIIFDDRASNGWRVCWCWVRVLFCCVHAIFSLHIEFYGLVISSFMLDMAPPLENQSVPLMPRRALLRFHS